MGHQVILMPTAIQDLEGIVGYIAKSNPEVAERLGNELVDKALSLAPFPSMGRIVPELERSSVREIMHQAYRIMYEVISDETIHVLRFWHAARGTPKI